MVLLSPNFCGAMEMEGVGGRSRWRRWRRTRRWRRRRRREAWGATGIWLNTGRTVAAERQAAKAKAGLEKEHLGVFS